MIALLTQTIQRSIQNNEVAGVSLLVKKDGNEICYLEDGYADCEAGKKMSRDTILRLYSQSKPICGAAAMILMERGLLDLYEPVSKFLPGFRNQKVWENGKNRNVEREMTIKDLLQMTSGTCYPDYPGECGRQATKVYQELEERMYTDKPMSTLEFANAIGQCSLAFDPGYSWNYGTSADILGAVIEIIAGMSLGEFMEKEIFEPLGMVDTGFWVPEKKQKRLSKTYATVQSNGENQLKLYTGNHLGIQNRMERKPAYESGGAGLSSTLDDYMKFAEMLLNGGEWNGVRILKKTTVDFFTTGELLKRQQTALDDIFGVLGYTYGNLMRVCSQPTLAQMFVRKKEYGWDGWLGTAFYNFPVEKMTILIGIQNGTDAAWPLLRKIKNIIMAETTF